MNLQISDKLICVDDSPTIFRTRPLKRGTVYVVRGIDTADGIRVVGITLPIFRDGTEWAFRPSRFRRLADVQAEAKFMRGIADLVKHLE